MRRTLIVTAIILTLLPTAAAARNGGSSRHYPDPTVGLARAYAVQTYAETMKYQAIVDYVQARAVAEYVTAVEAAKAAERAAYQAELARRRATYRPAPRTPARQAPSPSSGGSCGGATNGADAYIQRESGGSPTVANPSGAYGCYQIMPSTWASSCSDLGGEIGSAPSTQAACASRLPLNAWASSGPTG